MKQPWASALLEKKDVENRIWNTNYRGWILVHAGLAIIKDVPTKYDLGDKRLTMRLPRGVVIGAIKLTSVVRNSSSRWAEPGCWHWQHDPETAIVLPEPVLWRGVQGLVQAPQELLEQLPARFLDRMR